MAEEKSSHSHTTMEEKYIDGSRSPFIRKTKNTTTEEAFSPPIQWPPFEIQPDIKIYMYCTCAPCGDASMELCMAAQEDATPWEVVRQPNLNPETQEADPLIENNLLDGRAHFSRLGVVRRKPARTDAESTRSKSCSDKLALRQVSSLLSCETSRLVAPTKNAYLSGLALPEDEITHVGFDRCFGETGRMGALKGKSWPNSPGRDENDVGYGFRPFQVLPVCSEEIERLWQFAKPKPISAGAVPQSELDGGGGTAPAVTPKKSKPGNVSAVWIAAPSFTHPCMFISDTGSKSLPALRRSKTGLYETIINGVKQGNKASAPSARGASSLSRAKLWALLRDITGFENCHPSVDETLVKEQRPGTVVFERPCVTQQHIQSVATYDELKRTEIGMTDPLRVRKEAIQDAKEVLKGWIPNARDENWGLDVLIDPKKRKR
ncbi:uncharacterized protein N7459_002768 [Penicillium hispanicum]|uniref:uncharacterized protein n=1 Tax=Penicillium hispanicum TaxID=1080232 RepID=UPI002542256B|nr:uncharacterized protein N7459_002768 [Penicillium hispanicum]KAJ5587003.1 hypothetical protein N7459_002768 [Penicillium hispanicum]